MRLCSGAFAPWEVRDQPPQSRIDHLTSLFHKAANVGVLLFSQPASLVFDWTPTGKLKSDSEIRVWPRLLRTTNQYVEPLARPQVICEGSSQQIGLEIMAQQTSGDSGIVVYRRGLPSREIHELHGTYRGPAELPAPQQPVTGAVHGPQKDLYLYLAPNPSEQRDQDVPVRGVHSIITTSPYRSYSPNSSGPDRYGKTDPAFRKPVHGPQAQRIDEASS